MTDPLTLYRLFERGRTVGAGRLVRCFGADRAVEEQSYERFAQGVVTLASALQMRCLEPGQRVATLAANGIRHLQLMWAVPLAGGVFHAVNTRLSAEEIAYILEDADDRFLFHDSDHDGLAVRLSEARPDMEVLRLENADDGSLVEVERMFGLGAPVPESFEKVVTDENAPAVLCYTSGTTGRPKGVSYSHRALTLHALTETMVDGYGISNSDHVLLMVPFCHGAGWGVPYSAFMCGAEISVLAGPIRADHVAEILKQQDITFTGAVPEVIARIAPEIAASDADFSGLRVLMGGSASRSETLSILKSAGVASMLCWGMTETLSAATMQHLLPGDEDLQPTQGRPLPLTELSLAPREQGLQELLIRGPCVVEGYHMQRTSARRDGWFATGDTAHIEADGTLRLHERKKDLIKSGGEWISPSAQESVIARLPKVRECAVIGVPHPDWGERPLCVVAADEPVAKDDVHESLMSSGQFAKWQLPDDVVTLQKLPWTTLGKLDRQALRRMFCARFQSSPD